MTDESELTKTIQAAIAQAIAAEMPALRAALRDYRREGSHMRSGRRALPDDEMRQRIVAAMHTSKTGWCSQRWIQMHTHPTLALARLKALLRVMAQTELVAKRVHSNRMIYRLNYNLVEGATMFPINPFADLQIWTATDETTRTTSGARFATDAVVEEGTDKTISLWFELRMCDSSTKPIVGMDEDAFAHGLQGFFAPLMTLFVLMRVLAGSPQGRALSRDLCLLAAQYIPGDETK